MLTDGGATERRDTHEGQFPMPFYSNAEIKSAPPKYEPAKINDDGTCSGPRCCGEPMKDDGGCSSGCCDDYKCEKCGHTVRIEWPD